MSVFTRVRFRRIALLLLITALLTWTLALASSSYLYTLALTHPGCWRAAQAPAGYQAVEIRNESGQILHGWLKLPSGGRHSGVVLLGGEGASRDTMLPEAEVLARNGFGVLTIDYRSCAGQPASLGYTEIGDLRAGVDFLKKQAGIEKVGVLGFSVGGITAIRGAARIPELDAVVAMGGYSNLETQILDVPAGPLSNRWLIQRLVLGFYWLQTGVAPAQVSPVSDLPAIAPRPVFLIFGENELARARGQEQYAAARSPKSLWIVTGVGHGGYLQALPQKFERRVVEFFNTFL